MDKIRFGIISCGMIADFHAMAMLKDGRVELKAVSGHSSLEKTKDFAKKYGIEKVYMDYRELAADKNIDAVCVCSPSGLHGIHTIECLRNGKHVLCEKPLEIKNGIMSEMIKTAEDNNLKLGCVFPNRTRSGLRKAKEIIDSGKLGRMTIVECQYRGYRPPEYFTSSSWKGTKELDGGGCLMNQGIHAIDTMCWLTGDVKSVYGTAEAMLRDIEVEDTAMAILEFVNGAKGVLMGTTISNVPENAPEGDRIRIEFEKGSIVYAEGKAALYMRHNGVNAGNVTNAGNAINADNAANTAGIANTINTAGESVDGEIIKIMLDDVNAEVVSSSSDPSNVDMESHAFIVSDFVSAILENREPYIPGSSARKSVDLVLALYKSSDIGQKVNV